MKKLLLVFLFLQSLSFAQLNNTNRWMMRGDNTILSFVNQQNLTSDTLIFVVKASKDITAVRLIEKTSYDSEISIAYSTLSFIYIELEAGDTDDLTLAKYYYDITRVHNADTSTIIIGELYLQPDIGTPFDGTDITGRVTTVSLNNGTTDRELLWWNDSLEYWEPSGVTFSAGGSVGNADSLGSIPASGYLKLSDSTNQRTFSDLKYVDKSSPQTITGQKNFSGTVKVGSDTSIMLGYPYTTPSYGDVLTGLNIDRTDVYPYKYNTVFKVNTSDANTSDWALVSLAADFIDTIDGLDHTLNLGSNIFGERQAPQFGMMFEDNYEFADSGYAMEWYLYYGDLPTPNTDYYVRPMQLGVEKYESGRQYTSFTYSVNRLFIGGTDALDDRFDFQPMSTAYGGKLGAFFLNDSSWIKHNDNNFGWLYQQSNDNSSIEMMRVDDLNNVVISPDPYRISRIHLKRPIYGSITWDDVDSTGTIPIYRDATTNRIYVGGNDGMITNKIQVINMPQDTLDLGQSQFYVDPLTGSVQYTMPENLVTNGTFTDWTGAGKAATPNGWTFAPDPRDTTAVYIEQSPTGKLHFVWDGSDITTYVLQATSTIGTTYGYSFEVSALTDSALVAIVGNAIYISETGVYSGSFESVANEKYKIFTRYGAGSITLDNMKLWEIGGTISALTYDVPVTLDSLGAEIALIEAGNFDTTFVYQVTDSLAEDIAAIADSNFALSSEIPDTTSLSNRINLKLDIADTTAFRTFSDLKYSTSAFDTTIFNDLIDTKLDTMASDTSIHTLDTIDKVVSNSMIFNYEVKNVTTADEFTIFWTDDSLQIDSIQCESDDSVTIQIDLSHTATNVFGSAQLINGITTLSTFAEDSVTDKATLQFTQVGDNLGYLRLRIYWSFL